MENTSQIASISYDIETLLKRGKSVKKIKENIDSLKSDEFPKNLELIDAYLGKEGTSGCAFLDKDTGEVIVGFAGTNFNPGVKEGAKDVGADAKIGLEGFCPDDAYLKEANNFIKRLENYNVTKATGHSLGGAISVLVGVKNNIPTIITYNGAPLYVEAGNNVISAMEIASKSTNGQVVNSKSIIHEEFKKEQENTMKCVRNYDGKIIRFVSSKDQLNNVVDLFKGYYAGEITKRHNLEVIDSFVDMNVYSVTRKFDGFGTSAGRVWYLDGEKYDISNINTWIKELKKTSINLKDAITTTGEKRYYESYAHGMTTLKFDTISKLGDDFVNVTNSFIYKAKSAFEGTGLRSGKDDSIVNALEEVLKVELKNIEEIGQVVFNIADMAEAISMNFQNIDEEISKCIEKGSSIQYLKTSNMPTSYEAYLEENHILDDVKDIMEAFEMQVEESSERLANDVLQSYEPLINRTYDTTFKNIIESFEEFNDVIEGLDEKIYSNIKSEKWEEVWGEGNGLAPTAKKVKYDHGTLASNLPSGIGDNIRYAKKKY